MSVLSTALATLLTAQEARADLTLFLLGRLDPDSHPTEESKLLPVDPASFQFFSNSVSFPDVMACSWGFLCAVNPLP